MSVTIGDRGCCSDQRVVRHDWPVITPPACAVIKAALWAVGSARCPMRGFISRVAIDTRSTWSAARYAGRARHVGAAILRRVRYGGSRTGGGWQSPGPASCLPPPTKTRCSSRWPSRTRIRGRRARAYQAVDTGHPAALSDVDELVAYGSVQHLLGLAGSVLDQFDQRTLDLSRQREQAQALSDEIEQAHRSATLLYQGLTRPDGRTPLLGQPCAVPKPAHASDLVLYAPRSCSSASSTCSWSGCSAG
jgi:hypothetical protein